MAEMAEGEEAKKFNEEKARTVLTPVKLNIH